MLVAGLAFFFHGTLRSGFRLHQDSATDCRQINFLLEWGHRCLSGDSICESFWSPPIYHPDAGTSALTETLLGLLPFYSPFRWLGMPPIWAQYACEAALLALDFLLAFWLLRRFVGWDRETSLLASWVFAFGAPRAAQMTHFHLFAQAPMLLVLAGLAAELGRDEDPGSARWAIPVLCAGFALQLVSNAYLFWFSLLLGALAAPWILAAPELRTRLSRSLGERWLTWLVSLTATAAAVAPVLGRYLARSGAEIGEPWTAVRTMLPRISSWWTPPWDSLIYGSIVRREILPTLPAPWEHQLGVGPVTTLLALYGAWTLRRRPWARALLGTLAVAALLATLWPGGFSAWRWIHAWLPGASAIRAVGRLALVLLIGVAVGVGAAWRRLRASLTPAVAALLALVVLGEQARLLAGGHGTLRWTRWPRAIVAALPDDCDSFYLSRLEDEGSVHETHNLAMWASLEGAVPTINAWSSYRPEGWLLWDSDAADPTHRQWTRDALESWIASRGLDGARVCWLRAAFRGTGIGELEVERMGSSRLSSGAGHAAEGAIEQPVHRSVEPDRGGDEEDRQVQGGRTELALEEGRGEDVVHVLHGIGEPPRERQHQGDDQGLEAPAAPVVANAR